MNRRHLVALAHCALGLLLLAGIWLALPARWWWVDGVGTLVAALALASAAGLWLGRVWATALARAVSWLELGVGTLAVSALALSAAQLAGSYGPVGDGGALLLGVVALLVLPYLVVLPACQLRWLQESHVPQRGTPDSA
jgi:hypothetical protein